MSVLGETVPEVRAQSRGKFNGKRQNLDSYRKNEKQNYKDSKNVQ